MVIEREAAVKRAALGAYAMIWCCFVLAPLRPVSPTPARACADRRRRARRPHGPEPIDDVVLGSSMTMPAMPQIAAMTKTQGIRYDGRDGDKSRVKRVVRKINSGGMGKVDEVELLDGRRVARKTFEPHPATYTNPAELERLRKRFEREVKYQQALGLEGAMPILYADLNASPPWFLMPLAERSYADQIKEDRATNKISAEPLYDILSGLEVMHELGYVHRDLKPENVLLWEGTWRLSDFGLAANIVSTGTSRMTSPDSSWGTESYMAPEQLRDFKNVKATADIYSFGCILHDLIEGKPRTPYVVQHVREPYDHIVRKCTETDPAKRWKNVNHLRSALHDELRRDPSLHRAPSTDQWATELPVLGTWDANRVAEFVVHLEHAECGSERHVIADLREEHLSLIAETTPEEWEALALAYCEWARASFTFDFCDVIGGCLRSIFQNAASSVAVKANVATAMATIGAKNNRWYCMRLLNAMTDTNISDALAQRITIEIRANELHRYFEHCAREVLGWERTDYHSRILGALDENATTRPA